MLLLIIGIKLWAQNNYHIEHFYTNDFYYFFSAILRFLFGWIPFSVGDILYFIAGLWIFLKLMKNTALLFKKKFTLDLFVKKFWKLLLIFLSIYIVFNVFWGLNYNRKGIAWQLKLPKIDYDTVNLKLMQDLLLQKVNETKQLLISKSLSYPDKKELFERAKVCYDDAAVVYPFMKYRNTAIKSSLYGLMGDYLGFTGYYNPFTGEAQVNTTVPEFLLPYITLHEMGHQLGYAKEDEANFSGYLAAVNSHDTLFQYSTYLDLFVYANREVYYFDSTASKLAATQLIPAVKADLLEWRLFNRKYVNVFEPTITWLYGKYLQENQQPQGLRTYNEVIATLMAYYKKYGRI
ncbi:DUF3810 domain-containing protein [Ginsengibacter hankyongi]|uniref:DUF3810 domain-containing protein n=1 Tax=Ginsengibacter hankyongi TaxID=2607284 RepID=UPI0019274493|nr:DUF3810 domain-containing protein [Ginsengibacter hankyongi]